MQDFKVGQVAQRHGYATSQLIIKKIQALKVG